jgi:hypothetical protein
MVPIYIFKTQLAYNYTCFILYGTNVTIIYNNTRSALHTNNNRSDNAVYANVIFILQTNILTHAQTKTKKNKQTVKYKRIFKGLVKEMYYDVFR